jgi:hypothetical protein
MSAGIIDMPTGNLALEDTTPNKQKINVMANNRDITNAASPR